MLVHIMVDNKSIVLCWWMGMQLKLHLNMFCRPFRDTFVVVPYYTGQLLQNYLYQCSTYDSTLYEQRIRLCYVNVDDWNKRGNTNTTEPDSRLKTPLPAHCRKYSESFSDYSKANFNIDISCLVSVSFPQHIHYS